MFAGFITAGDPNRNVTVPALHALVRGGVDLLELGIPFSDPEADGPAIQASSERALAHGVRLADVLDMVTEFRRTDGATPIVLMGYLNSIIAMGYAAFAERASAAGVDGLIMVNLPTDEAGVLGSELAQRDLDLIFLVAPTTGLERAREILGHASGFAYYVSLKGTTGADRLQIGEVTARLADLRKLSSLPIVVGFGIKDGATARAVAEVADGIVVGTALVQTMADAPPDRVAGLLEARSAEIRRALDEP